MDDPRLDEAAAAHATQAAEAILLDAADYREGLDRIRDQLLCASIQAYFDALLARHGLTAGEAVRRANLDKDFGRQILTGRRRARRDYYLQLALGMGLSAPEARSLLNFLGVGPIYPVRARDAAILYALERGMSLMDTQLLLEAHGLCPLGDAEEASWESYPAGGTMPTAEAEIAVRDAETFAHVTDTVQDRFTQQSVHAFFDRLLSERGLTRTEALARAGLKESIGYQLLSGTRTAKNRDAYVRLALGLGLSLQDTQRMLKFLKKGELYPLKERDAALVFAIGHGFSLDATQKLLEGNGLDVL